MVLPRRVESEIAESDYGKFIISPLERGYGYTLGQSLKRLLLTSMAGAGITALRVNDGLLDYANIPGVRETVQQLLLQVKLIRPALAGKDSEPITLSLEHTGAGSVYASAISCPPNVRILNSELYLFTVDSDESIVKLELIVEQGVGYRERDQHTNLPEGFIGVETNFSPVRRVLYDVDAARVRQRTNYDKLIIEVWTDGTMSPQEALSKSAITMIRHLQVFDPDSADILKDPSSFLPPEEPEEPEINPLYDVPIEVLDLSTRVFNSLRRTGITSVGDVVDMLERGEEAMLAIRNFGQTSLDELKEKLVENRYMTEEEANRATSSIENSSDDNNDNDDE